MKTYETTRTKWEKKFDWNGGRVWRSQAALTFTLLQKDEFMWEFKIMNGYWTCDRAYVSAIKFNKNHKR